MNSAFQRKTHARVESGAEEKEDKLRAEDVGKVERGVVVVVEFLQGIKRDEKTGRMCA